MTLETITPRTVRDTLRQMSCDRSKEETPLTELETIRRSLHVAGFRSTEATRRFELTRLLVELVEAELLRLRAVVLGREHAVLADTSNLVATRERLVQDFSRDHPDLEGASAVYHLYIRTDLCLNLPELADFLGDRHRRTLQRRLQRGVRAIAAQLGELERDARIAARADRLARRLPPAPAPLFGRHALLSRMAERIAADVAAPTILALRGEAGSGKSALAATFARRALERGLVDDIAWVEVSGQVDARHAAADVLARVVAQLDAGGAVGTGRSDDIGRGGPPVAFEARGSRTADSVPRARCFGDRRVLVVVDGLDEPELATAVARGLVDPEGPRYVLLAGRVGWADTPVARVIDVPPLARIDALALLRHELERRGVRVGASADDAALAPIVGAAAGSPGAIRSAAAMLRAASIADVAHDLETGAGEAVGYADALWRGAWAIAPAETRAVVRAVIDHPASAVDGEHAGARRATTTAYSSALRDAVDRGMLIREGGARPTFRPASFLDAFLRAADRPDRRTPAVAAGG